MAVKKKEKLVPNKRISKSATFSTQPMKAKPGTGEEQKEAKRKDVNLPIMQRLLAAGDFLSEVRGEFRKISWPERSQVIRETVSVLFLVTLITFFVWAFDLLVGKFVFTPLEHWGHLYGIGGGK